MKCTPKGIKVRPGLSQGGGARCWWGGSENRGGQGGKQKGVGRCCIWVYSGSLLGCQSPFCVRRLEQKRQTGTVLYSANLLDPTV